MTLIEGRWRPIASAPRDGRSILVRWLGRAGDQEESVVNFEDGKWMVEAVDEADFKCAGTIPVSTPHEWFETVSDAGNPAQPRTRFDTADEMLAAVKDHDSVADNMGKFDLAWIGPENRWGVRITPCMGEQIIEYDADPLAAAWRAFRRYNEVRS